MKKLTSLSIITAAILTLSSTANADLRDGFYAGVQGGYDSYRIRQSVDDGIGDVFNPVLTPVGAVGGLFAGYGQYFCNVGYLGAEIFGNWSGANSSWNAATPDASIRTSVRANGNYGIHLLPGIKLNNCTLGYLRLGYNNARFNGQISGSTPDGGFSLSRSTWKQGWAAGVGMEAGICANWSIRMDYTYASYQSFNNNILNSSFTPSDNQFLLGVVYHFGC